MSDERLELEQVPPSEGQLVRIGYPRAGYAEGYPNNYPYGYREDVVVNLKLDQNPKFLDVTTKKSVWEAMQSILSKFRSPVPPPIAPQAVQTAITQTSDTARSREESARLSPYVDVLAANLNAEPLPDTKMLVISFTHTDPVIAADVVDNIAQVFIQRSFENKTESYTNRSEEHTSELQSLRHLVCRLLLEK